jgi:hypothetical protein
MQPKPKRPTGVTVLAILAILGALGLLFSGAALIGLGLLLGTLATNAAIANAIATSGYPGLASLGVGTLSALLVALGAVILILGILYFAVGIGFFGGKGWAWTLGIIVSVVGIVLDIVQIGFGGYSSILGLIIGILIIYYLMRPHVKAFFGKGPAVAGGMQPPPMMSSSMPMGSAPMGSMGMTCKNCGASIPAGATRCPSCGAAL